MATEAKKLEDALNKRFLTENLAYLRRIESLLKSGVPISGGISVFDDEKNEMLTIDTMVDGTAFAKAIEILVASEATMTEVRLRQR